MGTCPLIITAVLYIAIPYLLFLSLSLSVSVSLCLRLVQSPYSLGNSLFVVLLPDLLYPVLTPFGIKLHSWAKYR